MAEVLFNLMTLDEIFSTVCAVNRALDYVEDSVGMQLLLHMQAREDYCRIIFQGYSLWDSEEDCREWLEDGTSEPLLECLVRRLREFITASNQTAEACDLLLKGEVPQD